MRRAFATLLVIALCLTPAAPVRAQGIPVFDVSNLQQIIEMATRTVTTLNVIRDQYELITRMAKGIASMDGYKIPAIIGAAHDVARYNYGRTWLEGLNTGDARYLRYYATVHPLTPLPPFANALPPEARNGLEAAYATVEILDSVAAMGGHQSAIVRGYQAKIQAVLALLESDVVSRIPGMRSMTAIADKIAAGQLVSRRSDMAANQLTSNLLEQDLAQNKRLRDAEASHLNMVINGLVDDGRTQKALVANATGTLKAWRQP